MTVVTLPAHCGSPAMTSAIVAIILFVVVSDSSAYAKMQSASNALPSDVLKTSDAMLSNNRLFWADDNPTKMIMFV